MKIINILSLSAFTLLGALSCCNTTASSTKEVKDPLSQQLNFIVDEYFENYLKLNPLFATAIGDHRFDDQMTISISQEIRAKQIALVQDSLAKVKKIPCDKLQIQDRLTCEMFIRDLKCDEDLLKADLDYLMPFNQFNSFFSDFAELASGSSFITFNAVLDYENFLKRAQVVPAYIDTMIANMEEGMQRKITTPKILVEKALKQLKALLVSNYQESVFYQPLLTIQDKLSFDDASRIKALWEKMVKDEVYPSYQKLERFVQNEYLPNARTTDGLEAIPGGKEFYRALIKGYTTTDLTPDEVKEMGFSEVKRIRAEFEVIKDKMGFKGDLKAFFASLKEKTPELYPFHTAQEVMDRYWAIYKKVMKAVPEHFHLMPKAKFEIREVEKFRAENASEAYMPPNESGSRPGIFWVPIPNPSSYPVKDMECLFLHEAIPGHHFQISIQQELSDLCRYRKFMGNTSYIEGWALYSESLGKDLGMYADSYQWVGRLTLEMHRAIRLVVDTGIHWYGWSRQKAIDYSLENEPEDLASIESEIDRYMAIPGQAVSYKVGELSIQNLKERSKKLLGSLYQDAEFHDQILQNGSLPLSVLDAQVDRWIRGKLAQK